MEEENKSLDELRHMEDASKHSARAEGSHFKVVGTETVRETQDGAISEEMMLSRNSMRHT